MVDPGLVARARRTRIMDELERRGVKLRRSGAEMVGPCPACGGEDRFAVNLRKNVFHCRKAGAGGDAIAMVQYIDGCDFLRAVELLTGEDTTRARPCAPARPARDRDAEDNEYRRREIARAREIWEAAGERQVADAYLRHRGITAPRGAKIRGASAVPFFARVGEESRSRVIYEGPAVVAAIVDGRGRFCGCHITWIDPRLLIAGFAGADPKGKAVIVNPETGEIETPKKIRGSAGGGHIPLGGPEAPARLVVGEGYETTLSVLAVMLADEGEALLASCAFWSALSLGNLGGRALASVRHPTLKRTDSAGRVRAVMVPGPYPKLDQAKPSLMPPASATDILTLGDGDSDRFATAMDHARAAARWAAPGRTVRTAWADDGTDFNEMWLAAAAEATSEAAQ